MTGFLTHTPLSVTVIDPKITPYEAETLQGRPCQVRHVAAKFQQTTITPPGDYGLALLGLSLKPLGSKSAVNDALLRLVAGAAVVVIENALDLDRAVQQRPALFATESHSVAVDMAFELNDAYLQASGFARRQLVVLLRRTHRDISDHNA